MNKEKDKNVLSYQVSDKNKKKSSATKISNIEIGAPEPIEEQQKVLNRPTPCTVLIVVISLFALILLIVALGEFGLHDEQDFEWQHKVEKRPREKLPTPCNTEQCVHYASDLFDMMDASIDKCENFHGHVCSGYDPKKRRLERILKLIDTKSDSEHPKSLKVVRSMLTKCAIEKTTEKVRIPDCFPAYDQKNVSRSLMTSLVIHVAQFYPDDVAFFGLEPSKDSEFSIFFVKPNLGNVPTIFDFRNVLSILEANNSTILIFSDRELEEIVDLQSSILEIPFSPNPELVPFSNLSKNFEFLDWEPITNSWNSSTSNQIFGFNSSYYSQVATVIRQFPLETLYNLIYLRFATRILKTRTSSEIEESCLLQISNTVPGRIVLYGSADPKSVEMFHDMLQIIRNRLKISLGNLKWMDSVGIEEAQRKFAKTQFLHGFEGEEFVDEMNFPFDADYLTQLAEVLRWQTGNMFKSVAQQNESIFLNTPVFYRVDKNRITISRALLHYPFISSHLPNYTNYATIASRIMPHLIHIFDERGRFYDSGGRHRDWWTVETAHNFRIVVTCFEALMQDVLGASIALGLNAYDSTVEPYSTFPGTEHLSDTQLFFYSYVKTMCASESSKVNSALASVPQFNAAFNCSRSAKMNRELKCRLAE